MTIWPLPTSGADRSAYCDEPSACANCPPCVAFPPNRSGIGRTPWAWVIGRVAAIRVSARDGPGAHPQWAAPDRCCRGTGGLGCAGRRCHDTDEQHLTRSPGTPTSCHARTAGLSVLVSVVCLPGCCPVPARGWRRGTHPMLSVGPGGSRTRLAPIESELGLPGAAAVSGWPVRVGVAWVAVTGDPGVGYCSSSRTLAAWAPFGPRRHVELDGLAVIVMGNSAQFAVMACYRVAAPPSPRSSGRTRASLAA